MTKANEINSIDNIATTLGSKTDFSGTMRFKESLKIEGNFKGKIISDGFLYIEEGAVISADINVGSVVIGGRVNGNVIAKNCLELKATAQLIGNIKTAKLKIEDGVVFDGKCEMIKSSDNIDIFSNKTSDIKKTVVSD